MIRIPKPSRRTLGRYAIYYGILIACGIAIETFFDHARLPWEDGVEAREAAGINVKVIHYAVTGLWYGAWAAVGVIAVLALVGPLALRRMGASFRRDAAGLGRRSIVVFCFVAAIAMGIAARNMAPRLDSSFWGDEEYSARRAIVGQFERGDDGELKFREVTWTDTFFRYKNPNNHVLFSILARLSLGDFDPGDDPAKLNFDETRIRLPAFIAGLLSIPALGYLIAVIGYRRASIAAMLMLAVHPWFIRHGCEARGYPLALLFGLLALAFMIKAVRRGRWRYWAAVALFEFLLFYAYPGTIYLLASINLAALFYIALARRDTSRGDRITLGARWFAASTFAALPVVFLMAPLLPQMQAYLARGRAQGSLNLSWFVDNLSYIATGLPWASWDQANPNCLHLSASPVYSIFLVTIFCALMALGAFRLWRSAHRWLLIAFLAPYALMVGHSLVGGVLLYQWYVIPTLPLFIGLAAIGLEFTTVKIEPIRARTQVGLAALGLWLVIFCPFTAKQIELLRENSVEPLRESVEATRDALNPSIAEHARELTAQFCMGTLAYDPACHLFKKDDPQGFRALIDRAKAEGRPLHVNIALPALARAQWPGIMAMVDDPALFEPLPPMWGLHPPCTRHLFRFIGHAEQTGADGS